MILCKSFLRLVNQGVAKYSTKVELTSVRYPSVKRGVFGTITDNDLKVFESIVGSNGVITDDTELEGYNTDWLKTVRGQSKIVLRPKSTQEVSAIVGHCINQNLAICPQGGNTGLVGGSVPVFDEVIVSTSLMDKIEVLSIKTATNINRKPSCSL